MLDKESLLFVSHRVGDFGGVMAEYAEDKLRCLQEFENTAFVITSLDSTPIARENLHFYRVPSFSYTEIKEQFRLLRVRNLPIPVQGFLMYPIAFMFGSIFDLILRRKFAASHGGFWGWGLAATPVAISVVIFKKVNVVFSTGSASAGLVGALVKKVTGKKFYYEVPDPIVGVTMSYSSTRLNRIALLEHFLIQNSTRTVFVTKLAALRARARNPSLSGRITSIYPGAWNFQKRDNSRNYDPVTIVHLGSLYSTRNFNVFLSALEELTKMSEFSGNNFDVLNIGGVSNETPSVNNPQIKFRALPELSRRVALDYGKSATILLILQHADERSIETIPYKLYDYLNLRIPVIGLVENQEIYEILRGTAAFLAPVNSVELATIAISDCLRAVLNGQNLIHKNFDVRDQFRKIFETDVYE